MNFLELCGVAFLCCVFIVIVLFIVLIAEARTVDDPNMDQ